MSDNDTIEVQITIDSVGITRPGYGMPLIISHNAGWAERVRFYSSTAGVRADFASDSPEVLGATGLFGQTPKPPRIAIGRASSLVRQRYALEAIGVFNVTPYTIKVKGEGVTATTCTITSDAATSEAEIHSAMVTALNAVTGKNYLATFPALVYTDQVFTADNTTEIFTKAAHTLLTGDGPFQVSNSGGLLPAGLVAVTDYWVIKIDADTFYLASSLANALAGTHLSISTNGTGTQTIADTASTMRPDEGFTVTAVADGDWFSLEVTDVTQFSITQNHAMPTGLTTDLDAIMLESKLWYAFHSLYNSEAYILGAAAWAEDAGRLYVFDTNASEVITHALSGGTDIGSQMKALGYTYVAGLYHPAPNQMGSCRWMGRWLPTKPGSATAKFKTLTGLEVVNLNDTHLVNIRAKRMNSYYEQFGVAVTFDGMVFSTTYQYLDVRRDLDWAVSTIKTRLFVMLAGSDKVPYTKAGLVKVEGTMIGALAEIVSADVFADGTTAVEMPELELIDPQDKVERVLRNAKFSGTLSGAIHSIIPVSGIVTF